MFEILNKETLEGNAKRKKNFFEDSMIHEHYRTYENAKSKKEFKELKYHGGHLAAAANHKWSQKATDDTFLLSNIAPQNGTLNQSTWKRLEKMCQEHTKTFRNVCVYWSTLQQRGNQDCRE